MTPDNDAGLVAGLLAVVLAVFGALAYTRPELWPWWSLAVVCSVVTVVYLSCPGGSAMSKLAALWAKVPRPIVHGIYAAAAVALPLLAANLDGLRGTKGGTITALAAIGAAFLRAVETKLSKD